MNPVRFAICIFLALSSVLSAANAQEQDSSRERTQRYQTLLNAERAAAAAQAERAGEAAQADAEKRSEEIRAQIEDVLRRSQELAIEARAAVESDGQLQFLASEAGRKAMAEHLAQLGRLMTEGQVREKLLEARAKQERGNGDGAPRDLEGRVRALEERLGMVSQDPAASLEKRVAELERRTMQRERQPAPPVPPTPRQWDPDQTPEPSAPRVAPSHPGSSELAPERRREIEEAMRRMREEMDRLRFEMGRLREELGHSGDELESLRGLGYTGGSGRPGAK